MTFTDDDLKRLKDKLPVWKNKTLDIPGLISQHDLLDWLRIMEALLARLEAAEWLAGMAEGPQDVIEAWRKAAGK